MFNLNNGMMQLIVSSDYEVSQSNLISSQGDDKNPLANFQEINRVVEQKENDPFDKVLLERHIDNALLTSSRTIVGLNNTISSSLKIVHNKFTPLVMSNGASINSA
jgi:hypothetical protein